MSQTLSPLASDKSRWMTKNCVRELLGAPANKVDAILAASNIRTKRLPHCRPTFFRADVERVARLCVSEPAGAA